MLPPLPLMPFRCQMESSFSMQRDWGAMSDGESDEVRGHEQR